jgi:hypothetical protein
MDRCLKKLQDAQSDSVSVPIARVALRIVLPVLN